MFPPEHPYDNERETWSKSRGIRVHSIKLIFKFVLGGSGKKRPPEEEGDEKVSVPSYY
jgi:hypothetical protein